MKNDNWKILTLVIAIILALSLMVNVLFVLKNNGFSLGDGSILIQTVSAQEIYPLFFCPCCGQPLDKNNICCGLAQERIDYIDSLIAQNLSEQEIILTYVRKYGLNSFVDKDKQAEIKAWLVANAPQERPIISLNFDFYDLGDVSLAKGIATTLFELKNEGENDLIINKLDSSCGCTSASIIFKGEEGPRFAMAGHGIESPVDWEVIIAPGESAQLKVYYDSSVHQDLRGPVTRTISIFSNDPIDFEKKITIELNQVD